MKTAKLAAKFIDELTDTATYLEGIAALHCEHVYFVNTKKQSFVIVYHFEYEDCYVSIQLCVYDPSIVTISNKETFLQDFFGNSARLSFLILRSYTHIDD